MSRLLALCCWALWCTAVTKGYTGSDDRFVKKYAMMKVYESCFGPEVVREVRQEMRAASAKCQERGPPLPPGGLPPGLAWPGGHGGGPSLDRLDRPQPQPIRHQRPQPHQQPQQQQQQQADSSRLQQALMAVLNRQALSSPSSYTTRGQLDSALEPDFDRIAARIGRLPVPTELRRDMQDGVQFCRQFSQCIPDSRRDKFMLSGELLRPMFFFRCYKHKKLEACIMKDVRERYQQAAQGGVDDNLLPNTRAMDLDRDAEQRGGDGLDEDHMAAAVYEFLYGGDNLDSDPFF
ncbi:uncharacterized protein LOC113215864 [Frankliniella occidentalis]|uniref:Uncharacterized protein LOC113215864 n=1 Tax=Frankliniella occidentalis TaxID=133901 RepID=A0A9C6TW04_FRAOC|nr:uncharacterized protein LOC113215864 [Frankliniella occidentalis]